MCVPHRHTRQKERRFGLRRRSGQRRADASATTPRIAGRRATDFQKFPTEGFSNTTWRTQIVEKRTETDRQISGGDTSCVEARDWACVQATDRMVRGSHDPLFLLRRITPVLRGAACGRWPPQAG
jgi:hypothetical protein